MGDEYLESHELEPAAAPERFARWTSMTVAGFGGITLAGVAIASVALWTHAPTQDALATAEARLFASGLLLVALTSGAGLVLAGVLHHHAARARANVLLTYEGLVEETSQEFDKVRTSTDHVAEAVAYAETRLRLLADRVERLRRERGAEDERPTGPEPVAVNVLRGGAAQEEGRQRVPPGRRGRREQE